MTTVKAYNEIKLEKSWRIHNNSNLTFKKWVRFNKLLRIQSATFIDFWLDDASIMSGLINHYTIFIRHVCSFNKFNALV